MNGPQHLREAEHNLQAAKGFIRATGGDTEQFDRYMRVAGMHAELAKLMLDAAKVTNEQQPEMKDGAHDEAAVRRQRVLNANRNAWVTAITQDGAQ